MNISCIEAYFNCSTVCLFFVNEHDELNTADLPQSYNHRFAHVMFVTIRAPAKATLLTICAVTKVFFDDQLLAFHVIAIRSDNCLNLLWIASRKVGFCLVAY